MRRSIFAMILLMLATGIGSHAQSKKTDLEFHGLKGKVKQVRMQTSMLKKEKETGKWAPAETEPSVTIAFDEKGNLVEQCIPLYGPQGCIKYSYNDRGERRSKQFVTELKILPPSPSRPPIGADGYLHMTCGLSHDDQGNLTEEDCYWGKDSPAYRNVFTYNEKGHRATFERYEGKKLVSRFIYANDQNGIPRIVTEFGSADSPLGQLHYTYEFDSTGNWTRRVAQRVVRRDGKSYMEPFELTVRTISYFNN
jgi:hypothetical protein